MQAVGGEFCFVHTARHKFMLTKWNNNTDKRKETTLLETTIKNSSLETSY